MNKEHIAPCILDLWGAGDLMFIVLGNECLLCVHCVVSSTTSVWSNFFWLKCLTDQKVHVSSYSRSTLSEVGLESPKVVFVVPSILLVGRGTQSIIGL